MSALNEVHPFERAGLGVAPFVFVGMTQSVFRAVPDAPAQPGTTCDYCGTGIVNVCHILASDGKRFKVGCDCVRKTYNAFNAEIPPDFRQAFAQSEREKREARRVARENAVAARVLDARAKLAANPARFTDRPHPNAFWAGQGRSYRDYIEFLLNNAGATGRTMACNLIMADQ